MFKGVTKDERSDDEDEVEDEVEREREKKRAVNGKVVNPKVVLNGEPIGPENGHVGAFPTTPAEVEDRKATLRKR